jgi:isoamylase
VRRCIAFRRAHPVLRRAWHPHGLPVAGAAYPPVSWHGAEPWQPEWYSRSQLLAVLLHDSAGGLPGASMPDASGVPDSVYLAVNASAEPRQVRPPSAPPGTRWHVCADTAAEPPRDAYDVGAEPPLTTAHLVLQDHSAVVLVTQSVESNAREDEP